MFASETLAKLWFGNAAGTTVFVVAFCWSSVIVAVASALVIAVVAIPFVTSAGIALILCCSFLGGAILPAAVSFALLLPVALLLSVVLLLFILLLSVLLTRAVGLILSVVAWRLLILRPVLGRSLSLAG